MPVTVRLVAGRQRASTAAKPHEAGYTRSIRAQMKVLERNMREVVKSVENAVPGVIEHALKPIFDESQRLVPVDTGVLKRSGFVEVRQTAKSTSASVGYGKGGHPTYTALVHERMDTYHRPPTQAKYLERAVQTKFDLFVKRLQLGLTLRGSGAAPGGLVPISGGGLT